MSENSEDQTLQSDAIGDIFADFALADEDNPEVFKNDIPEAVINEAGEVPAPEPEQGPTQEARSRIHALADKMRQSQMLEPMLIGKDANLLQYNSDTGAFEPKNEEARHMLAALGEAADIGVVNPLSGSRMTKPVKFSLTDGLVPNSANKPVKVATNLDSKESMQINFETTGKRLERLSADRSKSDAVAKAAAAAATPIPGDPSSTPGEGEDKDKPKTKTDDETKPPEPNLPPTNGQLLATAAAGLATTVITAADKTIKFAISAISMTYSKCAEWLDSNPQGGSEGPSTQPGIIGGPSANDDLYAHDGQDESAAHVPNHANDPSATGDPITPTAETNATAAIGASGIAERVRQFNDKQAAPVIAEANSIRETYKQSISDGLSQVESALRLNEIGQIPLVSRDDFENRLKTASPDDKSRAEQGVNAMMAASEKYQKDTNNFVMGNGEGRSIDKLDNGEASRQIDAFDKLAANPGQDMEDHQKSLLDKISMGGKPLGESISDMFGALRNMCQSAFSRIASLGSSQRNAESVQGPSTASQSSPAEQRMG
ncbi:hypothetical protein [Marinobacter sp. ELB17]|uniref:hypothetical protein n=1 Tax=Marinobacter sp. ELB17 TaxID=270374 RepID=UPI0000F38201|nr:hypothetical protein [Marinobacter sp. ELB17]EAZ98172.1 hypothetical protein MELB17_09818 [Marinobacter sp. ELB17]